MKKVFISVSLLLVFTACKENKGLQNISKGSGQRNASFKLFSSAFADGGYIPLKYTCDGENISPPLLWKGLPQGVKSLALVVNDPDAPSGNFIHWIAVNIPPEMNSFSENISLPAGVEQLPNDFGIDGYGGPCPPSGTHRYLFTLYALNETRFLGSREDLFDFLQTHSIARAQIVGLYSRK